jgi:hypothetical protein
MHTGSIISPKASTGTPVPTAVACLPALYEMRLCAALHVGALRAKVA